MPKSEIVLNILGVDPLEFFGQHESKLNLLRQAFPSLQIHSRGHQIMLSGEKKYTQKAKGKVEEMLRVLKKTQRLSMYDIVDILEIEYHPPATAEEIPNGEVIIYGKDGRPIVARTYNQRKLVKTVAANDVVFVVGPAGTGKTYTAVALAVKALKSRAVKKIILTRPAVEAGENLGFLPGDLKEKVDPYLVPLYDALHDMIPADKLKHFMDQRIIEVAPLAYMRGRTLNDAFVILDEAQNATLMQIKMFLTRMGPTAKYVITGDLTQVDLPHHRMSGLRSSIEMLRDVKGIGVVEMSASDVVRHRLVKEIIRIFERNALGAHTEEE